MKRKIFCVALCLVLACSLASVSSFAATTTSSLNNFVNVKSYKVGQFTDVSSKSIFKDNIAKAYALGLMNGVSATKFDEKGNVTVAQAIVLASRIHSIYYNGSAFFESTTPWYRSGVDYALKNGIIEYEMVDYEQKITREEYATIMSAALPDSAFEVINTLSDYQIPDVPMERAFADCVYKLYRAGIMVGSDEKGTFNPDSYITRGEVSALVTRMVDQSLRVKKTFTYTSTLDANRVVCEYSNITMAAGSAATLNIYDTDGDQNGWIYYDNSDMSIVSMDFASEWTDSKNVDLYVWAKTPGTTTVTLHTEDSSGNFLAQDIVHITVVASDAERLHADMSLSEYNVEIPLYSYKSIIAEYFDSDCDDVYFTYRINKDGQDVISAEWNDWKDASCPLILRGETLGEAIVYVELYDNDTGAFLNEKVLHVSVR